MISLPDVDTLMAGGLRARLDALSAERAKAKEKVYWTGGGGVVIGHMQVFFSQHQTDFFNRI